MLEAQTRICMYTVYQFKNTENISDCICIYTVYSFYVARIYLFNTKRRPVRHPAATLPPPPPSHLRCRLLRRQCWPLRHLLAVHEDAEHVAKVHQSASQAKGKYGCGSQKSANPKMACPGKWNQGLKPAVHISWWLYFDPHPYEYASKTGLRPSKYFLHLASFLHMHQRLDKFA